ncbi:hypothetical protein PR048_031099 [Dryococelus australis]|uniref:Uncharacterized protein n=1 Tax=Dryococelus australis TaxID=614101 RepID=A0ABQ9G7F7_9NEOP|nr:hypothetical protein PR048_031099 [Dryococelus australis]
MEQRRSARPEETADPRENPLTSGIVRRSGFNPRLGHSGFSHVGVVPGDAIGRRVFSGISRFPTLSFRRRSILTSITAIGS